MATKSELEARSGYESVMGRREFLRKCGKYAVVVPPTMTVLLSRSPDAKAQSYPCPSVADDPEGWVACTFPPGWPFI